MQIIKECENNNKILNFKPDLKNSNINFYGKNNIIICEENVKLLNSDITFHGDDSIIYLSSNSNEYKLNLSINHESIFFIDENCYFNNRLNLVLSERKNIFIGKECLFAFNIWIRLADPHLIYDSKKLQRINPSKSVYIGDHVWIGQDALILKGTTIGSGSIIGAKSVVANKKIPSNTIWGGNPAKEIKKNIFFDGRIVHGYKKNDTEKSMKTNNEQWIYKKDKNNIKIDSLEKEIEAINNNEKINLLITLRKNKDHNRFFIK